VLVNIGNRRHQRNRKKPSAVRMPVLVPVNEIPVKSGPASEELIPVPLTAMASQLSPPTRFGNPVFQKRLRSRIDEIERAGLGLYIQMPVTEKPSPTSLAARRSKSAADSRLSELRRLEGMTVEQRIHAALTMSRRFSWLKPTSSN